MRVVWINSNDAIATPRYTVTFACYEPPEEFGALKSKAIVGEAELLRFLYVINIDADDLKIRITRSAGAWLRGIR